jgi:hypothetical protein
MGNFRGGTLGAEEAAEAALSVDIVVAAAILAAISDPGAEFNFHM